MANMRAAKYDKFMHGPQCPCPYDQEVRSRKSPATPAQIEAARVQAQAGIEELQSIASARRQAELDSLKPSGELDNFIGKLRAGLPHAIQATDREAELAANQKKAFDEFSKRGRQ